MKKIYPYLSYAGAIPFIVCAGFLSLDLGEPSWLGPVESILSVYALVIAAFLAGAHWGQHLHIQGKWSRYLPITSNIIAVALWLAFLALHFKALVVTFITAFVFYCLSIEGCFKTI